MTKHSLPALAALLLLAAPLSAHHSAAMFDAEKTMVLDGTVKTFEWTNPHAWVWVVSSHGTAANGPALAQGFELGALGILRRQGWDQHEFEPGDKVKVTYHPYRDGRPGGQFVSATFANGDTLDHRGAGKVKATN